uniref:Uncharacterized protein n=1 Tax=Medicago truncatula TaxID=3880 RepID=Q2HSF3_MEDTR|nr:hypothetical protein MtrDRAFT_AC151523g9v2 [Medicago truncatula]
MQATLLLRKGEKRVKCETKREENNFQSSPSLGVSPFLSFILACLENQSDLRI